MRTFMSFSSTKNLAPVPAAAETKYKLMVITDLRVNTHELGLIDFITQKQEHQKRCHRDIHFVRRACKTENAVRQLFRDKT